MQSANPNGSNFHFNLWGIDLRTSMHLYRSRVAFENIHISSFVLMNVGDVYPRYQDSTEIGKQ